MSVLRFPCFWALTEGARRATGVSAQKHVAAHLLFDIFAALRTLYLPDRITGRVDAKEEGQPWRQRGRVGGSSRNVYGR